MSDLPLRSDKTYWSRSSRLAWMVLGFWFIFSFLVHLFTPSLNEIRAAGFPMGYYMATQGSLAVFVMTILYYAMRQNAIDEAFGVDED
ncbi:MAG: DUF4212 domain-containing protein [Alphaproteobacteria bacterium]|nr:DUF4212 domain-containing protein [Alphaproteobacteria bacterium]